jgi:RNA polymerase sigma-70 factor (ECF subfamily)
LAGLPTLLKDVRGTKIEPSRSPNRLDGVIGREAMTEGLLARRASDSEREDAFARLIDRSLPTSYRLAAVLLSSESEAQDAVQDAAITAWERFDSLRDRERFQAWFQRILANRCRDRLRRRRRVPFVAMDGAAVAVLSEGDRDIAENEALAGVLAELSPDHRLVIVLRFYTDLSLEQIAEQTGARLGTVKSRLHYALEALRAAYDATSREVSR